MKKGGGGFGKGQRGRFFSCLVSMKGNPHWRASPHSSIAKLWEGGVKIVGGFGKGQQSNQRGITNNNNKVCVTHVNI